MAETLNKPLVSVLTPTWNRADYLERVWRGLCGQTCQNFEWIVADDGSTDATASLVRALAARSAFPVTLVRASIRVGKARMDNEAIACAQGTFVLWNDSDDYLLPQALETLLGCWNSIGEAERAAFVGVVGLCATGGGDVISKCQEHSDFDECWNELVQRGGLTGDAARFTLTSALREFPFPEIDFVVPEGVVWTSLGDRLVRVRPQIVKIVEYGARNAISFSGRQEYCRGRAYAIATAERNLRSHRRSLKTRLWVLLTFIRCGLHGEIRLAEQLRMWGGSLPVGLVVLLWPLGGLLAGVDLMRGTVRRTHREFLAATATVSIERELL